MKWLKKILRIIAIILPCFVALSITTPSFAKTYTVDSFMPYYGAVYDSHTSSNTRSMNHGLNVYLTSTEDVDFRPIPFMTSTYNSASQRCEFSSFSNYPYIVEKQITWGKALLMADSTLLAPALANNSNAICNSAAPFNATFTDGFTVPPFYQSSVPFIDRINVGSLAKDGVQYNFMYNRIPFKGTKEEDGFVLKNDFYPSDLLNKLQGYNDRFDDERYNFYTDKIVGFMFGLNVNPALEAVEPGSNIHFETVLLLESVNYVHVLDHVYLYGNFKDPTLNDSQEVISHCVNTQNWTVVCDMTVPDSLTGPTNFYGFDFKVWSSDNLNDYNFPLYLNADPDTKSSIHFTTMEITLNNDSTPGGSFEFPVYGSFPNVAPGMPNDSHVSSSDVDWTSSLINMFAFNFTNPFSALFTLFTDNNSCVNIPNLAGMLHAEDTQYCPWFDSNTRNILTPVLGISSVMLVFGFLVRWLGSSSGNLFDDETGGGALTKNTFIGRRKN